MTLIADLLLVAGALAAGFYCFILSRRLTAFKSAEGGIGNVVASLSAQVDELTTSLEVARKTAGSSNDSLTELTTRAEDVAQRLELMVAAMHDIPAAEPSASQELLKDQPIFSARARRAAEQ